MVNTSFGMLAIKYILLFYILLVMSAWTSVTIIAQNEDL